MCPCSFYQIQFHPFLCLSGIGTAFVTFFCCNAFSHFSQRKSLITKHLIDLTSVQYLRKILKLYSFVTTYRVAQLSNIYFLGSNVCNKLEEHIQIYFAYLRNKLVVYRVVAN